VIHFDTSFVVDFLREGTRGELGPTRALFKSLPRQPHAISVFALCELLAGAAQASRGDQEREKVRLFCSRLRTVYPDEGFAEDYASIVGTHSPQAAQPATRGPSVAPSTTQQSSSASRRPRCDLLVPFRW
jgi:predicted nucleic acid-binding protein